MPIHVEKYQENTEEERIRKNRKTAKTWRPKETKVPIVTGDLGNLGHRIFVERSFFGPFRFSRCLASVIFRKSNFRGTKSINLSQHHGSAVKIMGSSSNASKSPTGRPRKYTFCLINQKIDMIDDTGPQVTINV